MPSRSSATTGSSATSWLGAGARPRCAARPRGGLPPPSSPRAGPAVLAERLPPHLVPSAIIALDALPLTANGKVDRAALPDPQPAERTTARAPQTPTEARIASLWAELLGLAAGRDDDFFALGGHSLVATRVVAHLRRDLGVEIPLQSLFEHPTVAALAAYVDAVTWATRPL